MKLSSKFKKNSNADARLKNMRLLVQGLPPHNKNLLIFLVKFLHKVSQNSVLNKMTATNLATCWAPNLLKSENESVASLVYDTVLINSIVETLIENIEFMSIEKKRTDSLEEPPPLPSSLRNSNDPLLEPVLREKKGDFLLKKKKAKSGPPSLFNKETTSEGMVATGWMVKQGGSVKTWKRRYFVFKHLVLFYYRNPEDKVPLGRIPILGYLVEKADKDNVKKPFPFKLEHAGVCRTWYFSTSNETERDFWVNTINSAIQDLVNSGKVITEQDKEKEENQIEDDDEDIPEDAGIIEQEKLLKEKEERIALEEALLLDEEDRMKQEEELLNMHEEELSSIITEELSTEDKMNQKNQVEQQLPIDDSTGDIKIQEIMIEAQETMKEGKEGEKEETEVKNQHVLITSSSFSSLGPPPSYNSLE